jgi:hypothetical protein
VALPFFGMVAVIVSLSESISFSSAGVLFFLVGVAFRAMFLIYKNQ